MDDYEPLNLSQIYNAGVAILGPKVNAKIGRSHFRGLPFEIGNDPKRCYIAPTSNGEAVKIPVSKPAHQIIFAHRQLHSDLDDGGPVGKLIATYVICMQGGDQIILPIRERFEIALIPGNATPSAYGRGPRPAALPFRAVTDGVHKLMVREVGPWDMTGRRQTESIMGSAENYFLWSWANPDPESLIESILIIPQGPEFILAGVTLGHLDEHPFARQGRREVKFTFREPVPSGSESNMEVQVDRGDSTYPFALPKNTYLRFLKSRRKGYGEPKNQGINPSYAEIAAIPSATVAIKQNGKTIEQFSWGELERNGIVETPHMQAELVDHGRNWIKVTVLDEDTNTPVPCRIHFRSPNGIPYQPHGHHNQVNSNLGSWHIDVGGDVRMGQITYAYIDGRCQGWLPRGEVIVDIARGFEYEPLREKVHIKPGQSELTLRIKRWVNMNQKRWFSGDSHVHFLSTQGAHKESQGEDLNVVNLLQSQWGSLFTNTEDFTGHASVSQEGNNIVYTSQENRQHFMGHIILWGLKDPVMPWCSDGPDEGEIGGHMETTLAHWADAAHSQGGWVISPHFPNPNGEPAALIATERLDGIEMLRQTQPNHLEYYRYLNCGYKLPLVGGTDKMSSDVPIGLYRTYARIPECQEFNYSNWCRAVARGRTFLSGGPIISFSVNEMDIGDTIKISGPTKIEVKASAECIFPIYSLEIVQEGKVVARVENRDGARKLDLSESLQIENHTWLAARTGSFDYFDIKEHNDVWNRGVFAHTSPIYIACGGEWEMFNFDTAQYMLKMIEGDLTYIEERAGVRPVDTITHHHGEHNHISYLNRPFIEAREILRSRLNRST